MDAKMPEESRSEIEGLIRAFFEAGKNKDLAALADFHSGPDSFTKFGENPPYARQNSEEAFVHEQAAFANVSDYHYTIEKLRIDMFGHAAVATFYLTYGGMFVNDYSFEGSPVRGKVRATMVLVKTPRGWRIAHEHFSSYPDWVAPGSEKQRPARNA